jgi:hypothetical protein
VVRGIAVNLRIFPATKLSLEGEMMRFEFRIPNAEVGDSSIYELVAFNFRVT